MTKRKVFNEVFERVCKDNFGIIDIGSMGLGKWQLVYNHRKYYINNEPISIRNLVREVYFIPESKPINDLLKEKLGSD